MADSTPVQWAPVPIQWALHGKVLDDEGYHVIACSTGDLSRANFADALGRFTLGALDTLPQVSVSYLQPAAGHPGGGYLALAIHWSAGDGQRHADGALQFDDHGRDTTFTSYFCTSYRHLAQQSTTYLDMHKAFDAITLPAADALPMEVPITGAVGQTPAIDELAMRVASLLLTGAPVCVLGAENTVMQERLRFIDTVMALLPYGFRARMAAATWTRATVREHRFRLFFSSVPRSGEQQDHLVPWGEPDLVRIPRGPAGAYFDWLYDKVAPLSALGAITTGLGFGDSAADQALDLVAATRHRRRPRTRTAPLPIPDKRAAPETGQQPDGDAVARVLSECAEHVRTQSLPRLRSDITWLRNYAMSGEIAEERRRRYRTLITHFGLLRPSELSDKYEVSLYEALLVLAFAKPLTYEGYCQAEECLGGQPGVTPHQTLLAAIDRSGLADLRAKVIVYSSLDAKKLAKWFGSKEVDAFRLLRELGLQGWHRPEHARAFCDATLGYLLEKQSRYSVAEVRRVLHSSGYLAQALLRIGREQYQVHALNRLLVAAFPQEQYPDGLDEPAVTHILAGSNDAPTPALLAAVLKKVRPADAQLAWDAYVFGSITRMNLDSATHAKLYPRLPAIEREPAGLDQEAR